MRFMHLKKALSDGFTAVEFEAAKKGWLEAQNRNRSQDRSLMSKLSNNLFLDRTMMWDKKMEEKVANMTVEEVNKAMKKHLDLDKMILIKAGDFAGAEKKKNAKP